MGMRIIMFCNIVNSVHNSFNNDDDGDDNIFLFGLIFSISLSHPFFYHICYVLCINIKYLHCSEQTLKLCIKLTFDFDMAYDAFMIL